MVLWFHFLSNHFSSSLLLGHFFRVSVVNQMIHHQKLVSVASMNNREDGVENLFVLNGKNGKALDTDVYVEYLDDGIIHMKGTSDKRSWYRIGELALKPGAYSFSGLSGVETNTVGLELETNNYRFAPDVGSVDEVRFALSETTKLKV